MYKQKVTLFNGILKVKPAILFGDKVIAKGKHYFLIHKMLGNKSIYPVITPLSKYGADDLYDKWINKCRELSSASIVPELSKPVNYMCDDYKITQISFHNPYKSNDELLIVEKIDWGKMKEDLVKWRM